MRNATTLTPGAWAARAAQRARSRIEFVKPELAETNKLEVETEPLNSHRAMVAAGVGLASLAVYLAVMIGQLAYHPQIAVGVYLAVGGGLLFAVAALLAAYRESLLALPDAIERRKGVFQVLDWR